MRLWLNIRFFLFFFLRKYGRRGGEGHRLPGYSTGPTISRFISRWIKQKKNVTRFEGKHRRGFQTAKTKKKCIRFRRRFLDFGLPSPGDASVYIVFITVRRTIIIYALLLYYNAVRHNVNQTLFIVKLYTVNLYKRNYWRTMAREGGARAVLTYDNDMRAAATQQVCGVRAHVILTTTTLYNTITLWNFFFF